MKILLVEDDEITAKVLLQELTTYHYTVETTTDGQRGLELAQAFPYDLLLLDVILPNLDGISLCRQLRSQGLEIPILLLSAKDSSTDRVKGLEAGADDYVVKPYQINELIARIQALLRRGNSTLPTILTWQQLQLDLNACQVTYREKTLHLTPKEYSILELLLRNPRRIFSRSAILDHIWLNSEFPQEDAVSTQIKGLRQKLKAGGLTHNLIGTVYGLGYRLQEPPPDDLERVSLADAKGEVKGTVSKEEKKRQAQTKVLAVVEELWDKFKESLGLKIALFEQVIAQLATGTLEPELRSSAEAEAHRLIGSLGAFGLPKGSEVARQIEQLLRSHLGKNQAGRLEELVEQLKQAFENKPSTTATAVAPVKMASGRLLLVDDDVVLTQQVEQEAIAWGMQVEVATDLTGARRAILQHPPDLILLDLTFPHTRENGLTLLAELKGMPNILVLVMTGRNQLSDRLEVARLGGHGFLQKPITPAEILKAVTNKLHRIQKVQAKILIVDDDCQVLTALSTLLEPWGLQITTLVEPQLFWQVLEATTPDLLILDIEMPGLSGIELCQVVRNDAKWCNLPILFLSGHKDPEIVHQVFAVGADDFVPKPIVGPELIARILNRLERTRLRHKFPPTPMP